MQIIKDASNDWVLRTMIRDVRSMPPAYAESGRTATGNRKVGDDGFLVTTG
jgi:hypothetical protein